MNIYLITDEEVFAIAQDLSPSLAKRLCNQYNKTWSGATTGLLKSPKKLLGDVDTRLQCIVGYFLLEEHFLSEESLIEHTLTGVTMEDAIKHLTKYAKTV